MSPTVWPTSWDQAILVDVLAGPNEPELVDSRTGQVKRGVIFRMKLEGKLYREILEWDGPANAPDPEQVAERLRSTIGARVGALRDVEIGERKEKESSG